MPKRYERLSLDVIFDRENNRYFSHVSSARALERKIFADDTEYSVSFADATVETCVNQQIRISEAILISLCLEKDGDTKYIEIISSDLMGLFISDWF